MTFDIFSTDFLENMSNYLLLFMLIFTRWLIMTLIVPFLGAALLPALVRIGLAGILSIVSFLIIHNNTNYPELNFLIISLLFIKEAFIGFILGLLTSLIFYTYELLGQLIDIARSASMLKILVPELKQQSSPMGTLLFQLSLVLFFTLNLHAPLLTALYQSFERFPVLSLTTPILSDHTLLLSVKIIANLFELALRLALPVIFTCFLIDLAFGLLNRVAPQINAYFLSLPAKMMGGIIMLFFVIPLLINDFLSHYYEILGFFKAFIN